MGEFLIYLPQLWNYNRANFYQANLNIRHRTSEFKGIVGNPNIAL